MMTSKRSASPEATREMTSSSDSAVRALAVIDTLAIGSPSIEVSVVTYYRVLPSGLVTEVHLETPRSVRLLEGFRGISSTPPDRFSARQSGRGSPRYRNDQPRRPR